MGTFVPSGYDGALYVKYAFSTARASITGLLPVLIIEGGRYAQGGAGALQVSGKLSQGKAAAGRQYNPSVQVHGLQYVLSCRKNGKRPLPLLPTRQSLFHARFELLNSYIVMRPKDA
jgi:hypothetical protein